MVKNNSNPRIFTLNCGGQLLTTEQPLVMGILNLTPDSFFAGSRVAATGNLLQRAAQMLEDGAAILDIGGQSTRPNSQLLSAEEEAGRVMEAISVLHDHFPKAVISIDTFYASVARAAVAAGASIINDISGGNFDAEMLATAGSLGVPYICMHIPGTVNNMHFTPGYKDVALEVTDYFIQKKEAGVKAGIKDLVIDPGFGFGKTREENFALLHRLPVFHLLDLPVLVGVSRKSMIYKTLGVTAEDALNGTTVLNTVALMHGASILRVHDVKEAVEAVRLVNNLKI